jgi:hypothetical protein
MPACAGSEIPRIRHSSWHRKWNLNSDAATVDGSAEPGIATSYSMSAGVISLWQYEQARPVP